MSKKTTVAILALAASSAAFANSGTFELSAVSMGYKEPDGSVSPRAIRGIYEIGMGDNLSYEIMAGFGVADGKTRIAGANVEIGIKAMAGAYLKAKTKLGEGVELFGRAGFTSLRRDATASAGGYRLKDNDSGGSASFGAGFKFNVAKKQAITLDYMSYYSKEDIKIDGFAVGYSFSF